jgi:hypothetical protein
MPLEPTQKHVLTLSSTAWYLMHRLYCTLDAKAFIFKPSVGILHVD